MPVIEMRESLGLTDVELKAGEKVAVIQKRINLKPGPHQRNMLQMDLFFDDYPQQLGGGGPDNFDGIIEFFVTPTPIILMDETVRLAPNAGPTPGINKPAIVAISFEFFLTNLFMLLNALFKPPITPFLCSCIYYIYNFLNCIVYTEFSYLVIHSYLYGCSTTRYYGNSTDTSCKLVT